MNQIVELFQTYTDVYYWNKQSTKRIKINQGGSSSSKTISILQLICLLLFTNKNWVCTVVSQSWPNLSRGALRDFKTLIKSSELLKAMLINPNLEKGPYKFRNGSILEFVTVQDAQDAKSGKRQIVFINEANGLHYEAANQLIIRASEHVFIDYNPDARFWVHDELMGRKDADTFYSNFTHNPWCAEAVKNDLLNYKRKYKMLKARKDPKWKYWENKWKVYGLGITGIVEGTIFEMVYYTHFIPNNLQKRAYSLDWGFQNDPLAFALCGKNGNKLYGKELIYEQKLTTPKLIDRFDELNVSKRDLIIADNSNWDGIGQLLDLGYNVKPAVKGPNSRKTGVKLMLDYDIYLTHDSHNWKDEQRLYKYKEKNGKFIDEPADGDDHLWDALRYFCQTELVRRKPKDGRKKSRKSRFFN